MTSATFDPPARHWLRWAVIGFLGCCLVALTAFGVGYLEDGPRGVLERHAAWVRGPVGRYLARAGGLIGSLLLFIAWWRLRPGEPSAAARVPYRRIGVLWSLPLWPVPALLTADATAYAAQGWLLHQGLDPYVIVMGYPSPFTEGIYPTWRPTTAVYPPLALHLQHLMVDLAGGHPYWAPVLMRLLALAGVGLMVAVAAPLARQVGGSVAVALWFIALNPLILIQLIGGAHNDALMLGLIMAALWLARIRGGDTVALVLACVVLGVAAAVKQPAVLAGPGLVLYHVLGQRHEGPLPRRRLAVRMVAGAGVAAVTFVALSAPRGLWFGWLGESSGSPSKVINHSPLSWLAQAALALRAPEAVVDIALLLVSGVLTLLAFGLVTRRWAATHPLRFTTGVLLAFGLLGTAIQPWYVLWGGPLLIFCHPQRRTVRWAGAVALVLLVSGVLQEFLSPVLTVGLGIAVAYAWWRWGARVTGRPQHR